MSEESNRIFFRYVMLKLDFWFKNIENIVKSNNHVPSWENGRIRLKTMKVPKQKKSCLLHSH